jgi:predicted flap endonuclease-1-like 5' DNA nuclease/Ni/Fe-hydrogenase subunit HybB-like protein
MHKESAIREPLILGHKTYHDITEDVCRSIEGKAPKAWYVLFGIALLLGLYGVGCILYLLGTGIGTWGLNKTVQWAWDITNFVWWVGIGHAGTLISAVLLLFRQKWRMAINRAAEAMTIFAVFMAGLFPLIHMGRLWVGYWVMPIPNQFGSLWVNFNSPLLWDVFAITTYLSVGFVFWYIGLIPDFATIRDRAKNPVSKKMYSILSFGWSGRAKHWNRFEIVSLVLAGLATPLVFSVHSIVSFDFATSVIPGWHTTIFPPYFVAGAVFSGFAMVQTIMLIVRKGLKLEAYLHVKHIEYMNIVIMVTGSIVGVAYLTELFMSWYSGVEYESYAFINRATGPYWWAYASMMTCNVISPQLMWFKKLRRSLLFTFFISIVVNIGMWFERFVIIVTSLHQDYLPSSWSMFHPTWTDIGIYIGTIGLFFVFYLAFARYFPILPIAELKTILKSSGESYKNDPAPVRPKYTPAANSFVATEEAHHEEPVAQNEVVEEIAEEKVAELSDDEKGSRIATLIEKLGAGNADQKDDLKAISGVGPKLEETLNGIGIYTFEQVSKMTKEEYNLLDSITGTFPGRAERDDWAEQAKNLMNK